MATGFGCYECVEGHTYRVAAEHEIVTVGQITRVPETSKGRYRYVFSVNGVRMDDTSKICSTPLVPGGCENYDPVRVLYSWQPYPNSLLQDFADASNFAYRVGKFLLAIGLPPLVLGSAVLCLLSIRDRKQHKGDPDALHFIPR